jgi:hypothetical protein
LILYVLDVKNLHNETISRNKLYEISRNFGKCIGIWKIYITKQFREIIHKKFREISPHFAKFREIKYNEILRNFAEFREIKITFVVISYFAK